MLDVKNYQLGYVLDRNERVLEWCRERLHVVEGVIFAIEHPIEILEILLNFSYFLNLFLFHYHFDLYFHLTV